MNNSDPAQLQGVVNLDKPAGPSSAAMVNQIKRLLPRGLKVGHAGTLDPFATGVLLILVGKATRLSESLMNLPKRYGATIKLGATTPTDDPESPETVTPGATPPTAEAIATAVGKLIGTVQQVPPVYSAMKVGGRRAYALARRGKPPQLAARPVHIDAIQMVSYEWPYLQLVIDCGRGTYIRAIARDLGADLSVGGHLTELRRLRVGPYTTENAVSMANLSASNIAAALVPG